MFPQHERFSSFVTTEPNTGCWLWVGNYSGSGYGEFYDTATKNTYGAHRFAWSLHHGRSIPARMFICHACDVPACVNPGHLFIGSHRDNMADMFAKKRNPTVDVTGERNPRAKITLSEAKEIFSSQDSRRSIANRYNLSVSSVSMIKTGRNWRGCAE